MLAIEIDGDSHRDERLDKDSKRQKELEKFGIHFLRFQDLDVKMNMEGVLLAIIDFIENFESHKNN